MQDVWLTFRSITAAGRAAERLRGAGLRAVMLRTPQSLRRRGCGYSLRLRGQDLSLALELLRDSPPQGLYRKAADGTWEEMLT